MHGKVYILFIPIILFVASCKQTRLVPDGKQLLVKNKVEAKGGKVSSDDLSGIIKQKPNNRILGTVPFHLYVYNWSNKRGRYERAKTKNDRKLKEKNAKRTARSKKPKQERFSWWIWLSETVGEKPVIVEPKLTKKSEEQMHQYLKNKGYFHNLVSDTTIYHPNRRPSEKQKKAKVNYKVNTGPQYIIDDVDVVINDTSILKPIQDALKRTLVKSGKPYDTEIIAKERDRLTEEMLNLGFYKFNKQYIYFKVDSAQPGEVVHIDMVFTKANKTIPTTNGKDSIQKIPHEKYRINKVFINTSYGQNTPSQTSDTIVTENYIFVNASQLQFRPEVITNAIFFKPGQIYNAQKINYSYKRLNALRAFRFVNIQFIEDENNPLLNVIINLTPIPKRTISAEIAGTHRTGNLGVEGSLSGANRNFLRGAEVFSVGISGGLEAQQQFSDPDRELDNEETRIEELSPFNTAEIGINASLTVPDLFILRKFKDWPKYENPNTRIAAAYNIQQRPDYIRNLATFSYSYDFRYGKRSAWTVYPIDFSIIDIKKTAAFQERLDSLNNSFLSASYTDHFIPASRIEYQYNTKAGPLKNFFYLKTSLEGAGNALRGAFNLLGQPKDENGSYTIDNIRFAQYIRLDGEFVKTNFINSKSNYVYRLYGGVGLPQANLNVLPFEKSFFGGGANGLRAWTARTIGPGSVKDSAIAGVDRIGNVKLAGNLEYRFDLTDLFEGALFADAGNIWLLETDSTLPGADFKTDRFLSEIAIGLGAGIRLDIEFFIIRLDVGFQMKDPALEPGERWIWEPKEKFRANNGEKYSPGLNLNLGIGYPF